MSQAVNSLTVNTTKTNYKLFGNRMLIKVVNLKMQNVNLEKVIVTTFVGVFLMNFETENSYNIINIT